MYDGSLQHVSLTYKFTGKERDPESGLDNFGARFNSSTFGRFMTPDIIGGDTSNRKPGDRRETRGRNPGTGTCEEIGFG